MTLAPPPDASLARSEDLPHGTSGSQVHSPAASDGPSRRRSAIGTRSGTWTNLATFIFGCGASLAQAGALIAVGRAIGDIIVSRPPNAQLVVATVCATVSALCHLTAQAIARESASAEENRLRRRVLSHLLALGPARSVEVRTGATVSTLTDGAERVALYRQTFLPQAIASALSPLLVVVLLGILVDPVPAVVLGFSTVVIPFLIVGFQRCFRRSSSDSRRQREGLARRYLDAIQGLTTLVLFRAARRTEESLREAGEANRRAVMKLLAGNQVVILVTDGLFSLLLISGAIASALLRLQAGAIGVGDALAIVVVSYVLLEPLDQVGAFFYVGMGGLANQRAMRAILDRPLPAAHSSSARPVAVGTDDEILLTGADLAWAEEPVLSDVNLRVRRGEHLAVVGPSGAGKSTLLAALAGDLAPVGGSVVVDGVELTPASQEEVRRGSAIVSQITWLFTGTIADNLRLAAPEADEEAMWRALEAANLADEVCLMPEGLNTQVGEQGHGLSGGQAQRVSLARAFLAGRPILLLDEPTSQVDLASESAIVEAIGRISEGRTVVTVSHRAGALVSADRTVRVSDGRVVPIGTEPMGATA